MSGDDDILERVGRAELIQLIRDLRAELATLKQLVAQQTKALADYSTRLRELESESTRRRRQGP